jgi:hypothetical protein
VEWLDEQRIQLDISVGREYSRVTIRLPDLSAINGPPPRPPFFGPKDRA